MQPHRRCCSKRGTEVIPSCDVSLVVVRIIIIINEQRAIAPGREILFKASVGAWISVPCVLVSIIPIIDGRIEYTFAAKVAEGYWQKDQRMRGGKDDQGQPDTEVIDLKDLAVRKC